MSMSYGFTVPPPLYYRCYEDKNSCVWKLNGPCGSVYAEAQRLIDQQQCEPRLPGKKNRALPPLPPADVALALQEAKLRRQLQYYAAMHQFYSMQLQRNATDDLGPAGLDFSDVVEPDPHSFLDLGDASFSASDLDLTGLGDSPDVHTRDGGIPHR